MLHSELLKILVCPENHSPLEPVSDDLLSRLNAAIARRRLVNRAGQPLERPLQAGLLRQDGAIVYPVLDDIPMMLVDEGIRLDQPALQD